MVCATALRQYLTEQQIKGQQISLFTGSVEDPFYRDRILTGVCMHDLYDLIANIKKRPTMYLGRNSVVNLRTFLAGYSFEWR